MERVIYHLGNCTTCQAILKKIPKLKQFTLREIKGEPITPAEIDAMKKLSGSYEALFSRVALKYRSMGLKDKTLTEKDYRKLILEEYTFLKRPVMVSGDRIFIGNAPKTVVAMIEAARGSN
jgi:arsenate reductase (glutaredoxin)